MRDQQKYFPVNWMDGMKINKNHFIAQDDAWKDALQTVASVGLSPLRYGVLPASAAAEETYKIKTTLDNQGTLRVAVLACQAITSGGARISIPSLAVSGMPDTDGVPATSFSFSAGGGETTWWIVLLINPFEKQPAGSPDLSENPPRYPNVLPLYTTLVVSESQYRQYDNHPYALPLGKITVNGNEIRVDEEYIPPCISISAHPDLVALYTELDQFFGNLETRCSQIVQKIYKKSQQNDISDLVMFLCDRMMLFLGQAITNMRWSMIHESPAALFSSMASLARVMKNSIDLRIGSGKEELMNYLCEWCELKQGELESMLSNLANMRFDNKDVNKNIEKVVFFAKITAKLFETLSKLEFIGKRRDSGIFVKEEKDYDTETPQAKARRRFFG